MFKDLLQLRELSGFLFRRIIFICVCVFASSFLAPIYTKLQGENLTVHALSFISLLVTAGGLFVGVLNKCLNLAHIRAIFVFTDAMSVCTYLAYVIYGDSIAMYVIVAFTVLSIIEVAIGSAYRIKLQEFVKFHYYEHTEFYNTASSFYMTLAGLVGSVVVVAVSYLLGNNAVCIVGIVLNLISIPLTYRQLGDMIDKELSNAAAVAA